MKGHPEVIQSLQERLSEELAAILQYMSTPRWRRTGASRPWPST